MRIQMLASLPFAVTTIGGDRGTEPDVRRQPRSWLAGKRILITGATSGLGLEVSYALASKAHALILVGRKTDRLRALEKRLSAGLRPPQIVAARADLSKATDIQRLQHLIEDRCGGVDAIVNCAAEFFCGVDLIETTVKDFDAIIRVNLAAPFQLCRLLVPQMVRQGSGRVLNVVSATNLVAGFAAFRISKIGLEVLTQALIEELEGKGVGVAAVNPGWMRTGHSSSGRAPRRAAQAIAKLLDCSSREYDGRFFELVEEARECRLRACRRRPGLYGNAASDLAIPRPADRA